MAPLRAIGIICDIKYLEIAVVMMSCSKMPNIILQTCFESSDNATQYNAA